MLENLQTYQQILFDLTVNYLEPLSSAYQRLAYLFSLREESSGTYCHEGLAKIYGVEAVDKVVANCHEEVFERLLEMPLNAQAAELRTYLGSLPGTFEENASSCRENFEKWVPQRVPGYLKELYRSNLDVLLKMMSDGKSGARQLAD